MPRPVIALDADGVLLDYHQAYWSMDRFAVHELSGDELDRFRSCFDWNFWATLRPMAGAVQACDALHEAGYDLVCVSAVKPEFQEARLQNLRECGFPIDRVMATANLGTGISPKATALHALRPVAFVDDFLPYFRGIPADTHAALVAREPNGSPNVGKDLSLIHSRHASLADFARAWLDLEWRAKASPSTARRPERRRAPDPTDADGA